MLGRSDISRIPVVAPVMLPSALSFSTDPRCAVMVEAEDGGSRSTPAPNGGRRLRCECAYTCGPTPPIPTCAVLSEISNGRGPAPFFGRLLNETRRTNEGIAFTARTTPHVSMQIPQRLRWHVGQPTGARALGRGHFVHARRRAPGL
eukprot:3096194-Rhodomonas_salina.4